MSLSVAIITLNEEANIRRTLESVKWADEIVVVDSGSTDRTCEIAREYGAKVFVEEWKGFAKQKNSALEKCTGDWILSLDADEEVSAGLRGFVDAVISAPAGASGSAPSLSDPGGYFIPRRNLFLEKHIRWGGFYPDAKLRLFKRGKGLYADRAVHETVRLDGTPGKFEIDKKFMELAPDLIHHAYPTLSGYIEHMNRYSDLGAEMVVEKKGQVGFSFINIVIRPLATFIYNYFFRLGFLDGKEGLLLHLYHSVYVSWKYAKAWEMSRKTQSEA